MTARLWLCTGWSFAGAALLLLLARPGLALAGYGHLGVPSFVHLLSLGVILSGHYGAQAASWHSGEPDGRGRALARASATIWVFHVGGAIAFVWGLGLGTESNRGSATLADLGGHELLPTAIAISVGAEALRHARAWRRRATSREGGVSRHLPGLGLLVAMALGVMLVMDRATGRYGFYGLPQIALHALAAAFLFVLPAQALAESAGASAAPAGRSGTDPGASHWARLVLLAGFGLFAIALDERAFGAGLAGGLPVGLALLAAVALWHGLPAPETWRRSPWRGLRRLPWGLFGLMLLYGAIRVWRGLTPAEALPLAAMAGAWFLLGVAAPEGLLRMAALALPGFDEAPGQAQGGARAGGWVRAVLLAGALAVLAGQAAAWTPAVQGGALLWLGGWLALGLWAFSRIRRGSGAPARGA